MPLCAVCVLGAWAQVFRWLSGMALELFLEVPDGRWRIVDWIGVRLSQSEFGVMSSRSIE
jgi:hypothetical protein